MRSPGRILLVSALGVVTGGTVGLAVVGFADVVAWANALLPISPATRAGFAERPGLLALLTVLVPVAGGLAVGQILRLGLAGGAALGPADAILAVQGREPAPPLRAGFVTSLAALVSLGMGASVGLYGPLVHLGATIGSISAHLGRRLAGLRDIAMACGAAAAIAAAFNAPIAGLIFAHEVVLRHYSLRAFAPVAVAAVTGYLISSAVLVRPALFLVAFDGVGHGYEFVLFAIAGLLAAFLAVAYMTAIFAATRIAERSPLAPWLRPAFAGLVLGLVALAVPGVLGVGKDTLASVIGAESLSAGGLAVLLVAKLAMTALCLGFGFVGGVFSPALMIGVLGGTLYGLGVAQLLPLDLTGVLPYAICGMMAVTSPVIGAPLSTILIVFELTHSYDLAIAATVAVVFSNLVANHVFGRSYFDVQLRERGFNLREGRDRAVLGRRKVARHVSAEYVALGPEQPVQTLIARLSASGYAEAFLTDGAGRFRGVVRLQDAVTRPEGMRLRDLVAPDLVIFGERTTLLEAMERMRGFTGGAVPLVADDGRLLGVVPEGAVIGAYLDEIRSLRQEENAGA